MGQDFFDILIDAMGAYNREVHYHAHADPNKAITPEEIENIETLKYRFQDALNDYIDKRIELAARK